jgi:hypothetical protein
LEQLKGADSIGTSSENRLNSSVLLVPGVYWSLFNPLQVNIGYNLSAVDSIDKSDVGSGSETDQKNRDAFDQSVSIKPMLDFSQDLHFASRTEVSRSSNFSAITGRSFKVFNEARTAFRERKTRLDMDFNILNEDRFPVAWDTASDTSTSSDSYELRLKWTERWEPNVRTEFPIALSWKNQDTSIVGFGEAPDTTISTGYLNTISPGILFDWRVEKKIIREFRTQYYIGISLMNGKTFDFSTYDLSQDNKFDIMVKAGSNFFFRLLLSISYLFNEKALRYDMAELKATALF